MQGLAYQLKEDAKHLGVKCSVAIFQNKMQEKLKEKKESKICILLNHFLLFWTKWSMAQYRSAAQGSGTTVLEEKKKTNNK